MFSCTPRPLTLALAVALSGLAACVTADDNLHEGTGGAPGSGGASGTGGKGTGGNAAGTGGATVGTGGNAAGTGGAPGSGGMNGTGSGGSKAGSGGAGTGSGGSASGSGGTSGGAGGGSPGACPTNATFCSGFETAGLPTGAVYMANAAPGDWSRDFAIDMTVHNSGTSSLRVKTGSEAGTSGSTYKMLAVPATSGAFWVRFYIRSDVDMGGVDHNAFTVASSGNTPNDSGGYIEFAEDVGIAFNSSDVDRWPTGYGRLTSGGTNPYVLPKNTWHCIEMSFDSANKHQQLYINGTQQIDATSYPASVAAPYAWFKFGYNPYHGVVRQVWYDDVVVAPQRINCQ